MRIRKDEEGLAGGVLEHKCGAGFAGEFGFSNPRRVIGDGGAQGVKFGNGDPGGDLFVAGFFLWSSGAVFSEDNQCTASQARKRGITESFGYLG